MSLRLSTENFGCFCRVQASITKTSIREKCQLCMLHPMTVLQMFKQQNQTRSKKRVCLLPQCHLHVPQRSRNQGCTKTSLQHGIQAVSNFLFSSARVLYTSLAWHWKVIPKYIKQHDFLLSACCLFSPLLPKGRCLGSEVSSVWQSWFDFRQLCCLSVFARRQINVP